MDLPQIVLIGDEEERQPREPRVLRRNDRDPAPRDDPALLGGIRVHDEGGPRLRQLVDQGHALGTGPPQAPGLPGRARPNGTLEGGSMPGHVASKGSEGGLGGDAEGPDGLGATEVWLQLEGLILSTEDQTLADHPEPRQPAEMGQGAFGEVVAVLVEDVPERPMRHDPLPARRLKEDHTRLRGEADSPKLPEEGADGGHMFHDVTTDHRREGPWHGVGPEVFAMEGQTSGFRPGTRLKGRVIADPGRSGLTTDQTQEIPLATAHLEQGLPP